MAAKHRKLEETCKAIKDQIELVLASDAYSAWQGSAALQENDLIVVNNSFLFRGQRPTSKSGKYLGVLVGAAGPEASAPAVLKANRINLQFKRIHSSQAAKYPQETLEASVANELPRVGSIVMAFVGRIGPQEGAEVSLAGLVEVQNLSYSPGQAEHALLADRTISLNALSDLDVSWAAVASLLDQAGLDKAKLEDGFEPAFHDLQERAARPVDPLDVDEAATSILSEVRARMKDQITSFSDALKQYRADPQNKEAYNELLRVAYVFADGALAFLNLMVGICDLKPLIFWLTVFEQIDLAYEFGQLPFSLVGKEKPSMTQYRKVIAEARNQAFHDLFGFDHPFRVRLPQDALRSPELRLFQEYGQRGTPTLNYEDRTLVELLDALTRTPKRPVPLGFWDRNERVMNAVAEVVEALRKALILVS